MHVEQPLQKKKKKEWHDFTILFASICTVTPQQNYDIMIQQQSKKRVYHPSHNIHNISAAAILPELYLKSHLVPVFHLFQLLR